MKFDIQDIWEDYRISIKIFLHSKISNHSDAEDLLQEIFIRMYKNIDSVKTKGSLKSWIFQVANHVIVDYYREKAKFKYSKFEDKESNVKIDPYENLSDCIAPFIKKLPKESRKLLTAIELNGISQIDYAKELNINYSTLKSQVKKSRLQLQDIFKKCCNFSFDGKGHIIDFSPKRPCCKKY